MLTIDWQDSGSQVLINPRMPASEALAARRVLLGGFPLPAHVWMATSGSSGHFKWVALSKQAILASAAGVNRHLGARSRDVFLSALPAFHVGGIGAWARAHLAGARLIDALAGSRWSAEVFRRLCESEGGTIASLVPAQLFDLVKLGLPAPPSLRALLIGGGALDESLYSQAKALGWDPLPSYGATECCSTIAAAAPEGASPQGLPGMRLLPHLEGRVDPPDGVLAFRGPSLLSGYVVVAPGRPAEWTDPKRDGWFVSEDLGEITGGFVTLRGRRSDFIKIGGESVDLARLERLWSALRSERRPAFDLALLPVPDARLGHVIHAATAASGGSPLADEARRFVEEFNSRVLPFERARELHFMPFIPRSPLGKLLRRELLGQLRLQPSPGRSPANWPSEPSDGS